MTAQAYSQYDVAVCDRYPLPRRQTEIPTDLFSEVIGIIVLRIFVEDLDLVIEQDDLIYEGVDQQMIFLLAVVYP
ncbi:MAG: hypothetical protein J6M42_06830 [Clostridia bacterium]|nr:hypothetical protein [Clostridia bacterium]